MSLTCDAGDAGVKFQPTSQGMDRLSTANLSRSETSGFDSMTRSIRSDTQDHQLLIALRCHPPTILLTRNLCAPRSTLISFSIKHALFPHILYTHLQQPLPTCQLIFHQSIE